uniref:Tubulin-specific chaperone D n=1 Tax=Lepeophtheirus salmonis TaxID=72036 RepID=A0A0K2V1L8_LEPSM
MKSENTLVRKFYLKLAQRVALNFLPSKMASWRRKKVAKKLLCTNPLLRDDDIENEEEFVVTEDESCILENIVQDLLDGLKDKDTAVRWSAAKGIGRITNHIPIEFCDDIISSLVALFSFRETDNAWHGGCLALAELARRGLILDSRLNDVMSVVTVALLYDERKGCYSVGSHVRDAACYVCWSFSRSYTKQTLGPYTCDFANALLSVMLFDREITCRRAASATFQEIVGRQDLFAHGLEILPITDYYAVGNRTHTYLSLSVTISEYPEYTSPLFKHILLIKTMHWDVNIRELSSQALKNLTVFPTNRDYAIKQGLNDLYGIAMKSEDARVIHGVILGYMDIIYGIVVHHGLSYVTKFLENIRNLSQHLSEKMQQSSLGRELLHLAHLTLIKNASLSAIPFHKDDVLEMWQSIIDDGIPSTDLKIRDFAISTIQPFFQEYFIDSFTKKVLIDRRNFYINKYIQNLDQNFNMREGFTLALGNLPFKILCSKFAPIVEALCKCTRIKNGTEMWAESRRNAIQGICQIFVTMEHQDQNEEFKVLIPQVFECFIEGLNDYTIERRGDIGAWVREAAISGLFTITSYCQKIDFNCSQYIMHFSPLIARQAVEKIDRTRSLAAKTFFKFVRNSFASKEMPDINGILLIFESLPEDFSWSSESETFPLFVQLIKYEKYRSQLILGLIVSIGGVSFGLVKHASSSLFSELAEADNGFLDSFLINVVDILNTNSGNERIVNPYFGFIKHLVEAGNFEDALKNRSIDIFSVMNKEITNSKDPKKILSFIDAICSLFQIEDSECQTLIYKKLVGYLFHRYPRIRKMTSCKLYETLTITDVEIISENDLNKIMSILNDNNWDSTEIKELRPLKTILLSFLDQNSA